MAKIKKMSEYLNNAKKTTPTMSANSSVYKTHEHSRDNATTPSDEHILQSNLE